ncbi:uncharacterized protein WCC33_017810 [Rhinophrynus dorsalis]
MECHHADVARVLQKLIENNLLCKIEKCEFHRKQVTFLWYVISEVGFTMDPEKLSSVLKWPRPVGLCSLQRFLKFAKYYRKFIRKFFSIVKPLTNMTKKDSNSTHWSPEAIKTFQA